MEHKICFSKRIGYLALFGAIVVSLVGALNLLTRQKTSTSSRAQVSTETPIPLPTLIPTPSCNAFGDVIVKETVSGSLWSWGSLLTKGVVDTKETYYCSSQQYLPLTPTPFVTPILHPHESKASNYTEYFDLTKQKFGNELCRKYGVSIDITSNVLIDKNQTTLYAPIDMGESRTLGSDPLREIPATLVGTTVKLNECKSTVDQKCKSRYEWIDDSCWHLTYSKSRALLGTKNTLTCTSFAPGNIDKKACLLK